MSTIIHFGTGGWYARRDGDFTDENVVRLADAAAQLWARSNPGAIVYIGFDAREGAEQAEAGGPEPAAEPAPEREDPGPAPAAPPEQEMTAQQLRDAIEAKGGFAPKKANKAQLAELLGAL